MCQSLCIKSVNGSRSAAGNSLNLICHKYNMCKYELDECDCGHFVHKISDPRIYSETEEARVTAVREFVQWRDTQGMTSEK